MRNILAHCWTINPKEIYNDAKTVCLLEESIEDILRNSYGVSQKDIRYMMKEGISEFERICAIIDSKNELGELIKLTIFERHEDIDNFHSIRETVKEKRVEYQTLFAKIAFGPDAGLIKELYEHYDRLGAFDQIRENIRIKDSQKSGQSFRI